MSYQPRAPKTYPTFVLEGTRDLGAERQIFDLLVAELFEAGCLGIESLEGARQRVYFPVGSAPEALRGRLVARYPTIRIGPIERVPDQDWVALSRKDMSGFAIGERFFVCPSWETPPPSEEIYRSVLHIDPEQAFGTGRHDTTRLCIELLEAVGGSDVSLVDVGTGTGILAMVGARLGCRPVVALDIDPDAVDCARRNAQRNHLDGCMEVVHAAAGKALPDPAALVVANLSRALLEDQLPRLAKCLAPGGHMILSGITLEDVEELTTMLERLPRPLRIVRYHTAGDWAALLATSSAGPTR